MHSISDVFKEYKVLWRRKIYLSNGNLSFLLGGYNFFENVNFKLFDFVHTNTIIGR